MRPKVSIHVLSRLGHVGAAIRADGRNPVRLLVGSGTNPAHGLLCEMEAAFGAISLLTAPCDISIVMNSGIAPKMAGILNAEGNGQLTSIKESYVEALAMHSISFSACKDSPEKKLLLGVQAANPDGFWGLFVIFNNYDQPGHNLLCAWSQRPSGDDIAKVLQLREFIHIYDPDNATDIFTSICDTLASLTPFSDGKVNGNHRFFIKRVPFGEELPAGY